LIEDGKFRVLSDELLIFLRGCSKDELIVVEILGVAKLWNGFESGSLWGNGLVGHFPIE
jgi:hypothetical protein